MWTADIGTWERGMRVALPDAKDVDSALRVAENLVVEHEQELRTLSRFSKDDTPYVVQVFNDHGERVWDYMRS